MLDRIKKKQWDGFKDFVESLECSLPAQRSAILLNGILEDPRFMCWVTRNLRGFPHFLELPADEIEAVIRSNDSMLTLVAKALGVGSEEELQGMAHVFPRHMGKLRDEWGLLKEVPHAERESARFFLLKTVRKLQRQELIQGFRWELPPPETFLERPAQKDGVMRILYEDQTLAAEGEMLKGRRIGQWKHFYENGKLLGEGSYLEGFKNGEWTFYYGNGARRSRGKFRQDLRHGLWKEWDREGGEREVEWVEGKRKEE